MTSVRARRAGGAPRARLVGRPREGQPLDAVRVGVLRRGEAALGQAQLAEQVVEASPRRRADSARRRSRPRRGGRSRRAARCRRASSRSAGRARPGRPSSGGSRRRRGRTCRPRPSRRASIATIGSAFSSPRSACAAGTRASRAAGTSARPPSLPTPGRTAARRFAGRLAEEALGERLGDGAARSRRTASTSARLRRDVGAALAVRVETASSTSRKLGRPCRGSGG